MEPNGAPPAPPPMTPSGPSNPYDFLQDKPAPKKPLLRLPSGGSKTGRIIVVLVGVVLMIVIGMVLMTVLNAPSRAAANDLVLAAQQQQELIRVAEIGEKEAVAPDTKNLAVNIKLTLKTDQPKLQAIVNKAKKLDAKILAAGRDSKTDSTLNSARQANRFDEVFQTTIKKELTDYMTTLKRVHDNSSNTTNKQVLTEQYNHVKQLAASIPGE
jgi:hypothetical protein